MTYDGVGYLDAPPVYPNRHHARAPLIGAALGDVLRIAYLYPRNHGRVLISQSSPANFRASAPLLTASNAALARVAEGLARIPPVVTHLVGVTWFRVLNTNGEGLSAYHRLSVTSGANTDTGATVETELPSLVPLAPRQAFEQVFQARFEVELANVTGPTTGEIKVDGYAKMRRTGAGVSYVHLLTRVWTEIR